MSYITVNDIELYYETHGEGVPLLLIAGLASDSQSWLPVVEGLSRHYRVIVFDNRGVGRATPQNVEISIPQMAEDCVALLKALGISSACILGHSMGGFVALECAIRHPHSISKLILAGTSAFGSERNKALIQDWASYLDAGMTPELWFRNIFYWVFSSSFFDNRESVSNAIRMMVDYPYPQTPLSFQRQVEAIQAFNRVDSLGAVTAKTLILCGGNDLLFPPEESVNALSTIPDARVAVIEQAAHSMHVERPEEFIRVVLDFLKEQD